MILSTPEPTAMAEVKLSRNAPERRCGTSLRAVIEGRMGRDGNGGSVPALLFSQFNLWETYVE
jgi:hypothetical protein